MQYLGIMREHTAVFPAAYWAKYDGRVTYQASSQGGGQRGTGTGKVGVATYNYATPWALVEATTSPSFQDRQQDGAVRSRKRAVNVFGWVFFLITSGSPHVRPMGRTCGEPDENELTAMGVKLNGSHCRR